MIPTKECTYRTLFYLWATTCVLIAFVGFNRFALAYVMGATMGYLLRAIQEGDDDE